MKRGHRGRDSVATSILHLPYNWFISLSFYSVSLLTAIFATTEGANFSFDYQGISPFQFHHPQTSADNLASYLLCAIVIHPPRIWFGGLLKHSLRNPRCVTLAAISLPSISHTRAPIPFRSEKCEQCQGVKYDYLLVAISSESYPMVIGS